MGRLRSGEPSSHHTGPPFAERPLEVVHGPMRGRFRLAVGHLLGIAYRPPGRHQPAIEIGAWLVEIGVPYAPKPAADDEVATVLYYLYA
jgi:hypothetical protein